jgi:hypothetical protein
MSDYLENKLLDHLRGIAFTAPSTWYVALHTATPIDSGGGTEVSGGSYARQAVSANSTALSGTQGAGTTGASSGASGAISNNNAIAFTNMPACTVVGIGIYDASTGGNLLWYGAVGTSKTFNAGDTANFAAGQLSIQIDN